MNSFKLVLKIIPNDFRNKTKFLLFLFLIGSGLEVISIGAFLPLLTELTNSEIQIVEKLKYIILINFPTLQLTNWIYFFLILIIAIFLIKTLMLIFIIYFQNKYIQDLTVNLSAKLLGIYLKQSFLFHKKNNSSKLIRNINLEISSFIIFFTNVLRSISELIFITGIIIFLLVINPLITIFVITFFLLISLIFNVFTKKILNKLGHIRHKFADIAIRNIQQSLGGIKEIKIGNLENKFTLLYKLTCSKIASAVSLFSTLQQLPRVIFEFLLVFSACLIILITFNNFQDTYILTLVGIYTLIAIKTVPSIIKVYLSIQQVIFNFSAVKTLNKEFNLKIFETSEKKIPDLFFKRKIEFKNVTFKYPEAKSNTIKNISFEIEKNEKIGIVGESGVGKSTLIDLLMGLIDPTSGQIDIDKKNLKQIKTSWQKLIGYVPQNIYLLDDTIKNNLLLFYDKNYDKKRVREILKASNLEKLISKLPGGLNTIIGERGDRLSSGQKQRLGIARALYKNSQLIILDEPTSSLDSKNEISIINEILKIQNITLIVITHNEKILNEFDKIISIKNGQIYEIKKKNNKKKI